LNSIDTIVTKAGIAVGFSIISRGQVLYFANLGFHWTSLEDMIYKLTNYVMDLESKKRVLRDTISCRTHNYLISGELTILKINN
jgi:hypothetical protein